MNRGAAFIIALAKQIELQHAASMNAFLMHCLQFLMSTHQGDYDMMTLAPVGADEMMNIGMRQHNNTMLQAVHSGMTMRCFRQCRMEQHNLSGSTQQRNNKMLEAAHNGTTTG
jgi:hypothetical protein